MTSKKMTRVGWTVSAVAAFFILMAAIPKLMQVPAVIQGFQQAGWPAQTVVPVGIIEFLSVLLYLFPGTRVLGAILLTGVMGGAIATNLRVGNPALVMTFLLGALVWVGLYLRDERLRALIPLRS